MFRLDSSDSRFLRIDASGRLTPSDYDVLEPKVEAALRQARRKRVALLLDLRGWSGWTAGGFVRDLRFDWVHRSSFARIAVLGDRRWHQWVTIAAKPLFSGPMLYFDVPREAEAVEWVAG